MSSKMKFLKRVTLECTCSTLFEQCSFGSDRLFVSFCSFSYREMSSRSTFIAPHLPKLLSAFFRFSDHRQFHCNFTSMSRQQCLRHFFCDILKMKMSNNIFIHRVVSRSDRVKRSGHPRNDNIVQFLFRLIPDVENFDIETFHFDNLEFKKETQRRNAEIE